MPDEPNPPPAEPVSKPVLDATTDLLLAASELVRSLRSRAEQHARNAKPRATKKASAGKKAAHSPDGPAHRMRLRLERAWHALIGPEESDAPSAARPAARGKARKRG